MNPDKQNSRSDASVLPESTNNLSYGVISLVKANHSHGKLVLFGSSIVHHSSVVLTIERAKLYRDLSRDWIMPSGEPAIVQVEMSSTQFADAITSFSKGEGTPCTIRIINGKRMSDPPFESKRIQFDTEFENKVKEVTSETNKFYTQIQQILAKPNIGKHDKEEIMKQLDLLRQSIASNIPFVKKQFSEQMDKTVLEAKNEVEAFLESKVRSMGLKGVQALDAELEYRKDDIKELENKGET